MAVSIAALLASIALNPIVCHPSPAAYAAAAGLPASTVWYAGIGGYYRWANGEIGLTNQTCINVLNLRSGYTWQRGYAVFTVAHELGHASGIADEASADCYGAAHAPQVAHLFGLRARSSFQLLRSDGLLMWGYHPIPPGCFTGTGP